jgi:hypothetical protein
MPQMVALHWPCMLCAGHACGALAMHAVHLQVAQAMLPEVAAELIDRRDTAIATKLLELSGAQGETQGPLVATVALFQMDGVERHFREAHTHAAHAHALDAQGHLASGGGGPGITAARAPTAESAEGSGGSKRGWLAAIRSSIGLK